MLTKRQKISKSIIEHQISSKTRIVEVFSIIEMDWPDWKTIDDFTRDYLALKNEGAFDSIFIDKINKSKQKRTLLTKEQQNISMWLQVVIKSAYPYMAENVSAEEYLAYLEDKNPKGNVFKTIKDNPKWFSQPDNFSKCAGELFSFIIHHSESDQTAILSRMISECNSVKGFYKLHKEQLEPVENGNVKE